MTTIRLPVSGLAVDVRSPTGAEDVLLADAETCDWPLTIELVERLARAPGGDAVNVGALSVTDLDALLLLLRRARGADWLRANVDCPAPGCGKPMEIAFSVADYLEHHEPELPEGVAPVDEHGWFGLEGTDVSFRLPCCDDIVELTGRVDAAAELVRRCVRPTPVPVSALRRAEAAMEALAPSLSRELEATCPECGHVFLVDFDVQLWCGAELRRHAMSIFTDVAAIAARFHWSEGEILALPRQRRLHYAELARSAA
jgi:hypothetical protein